MGLLVRVRRGMSDLGSAEFTVTFEIGQPLLNLRKRILLITPAHRRSQTGDNRPERQWSILASSKTREHQSPLRFQYKDTWKQITCLSHRSRNWKNTLSLL